jgi:hypothetical protein
MPNQELAKPQRDFSRRTSLPIPPPSVIVPSRQGSFRGLTLIELQLRLKDFQRSASAVNGDCSNLHDGPPRLLAGRFQVNKDKSTGKPLATAISHYDVRLHRVCGLVHTIRHSRRHTTVFTSLASGSKLMPPPLPSDCTLVTQNPTTGC